MVKLLETLKHIEYHGVRELARAAEHFLRSTGTIQEKGTVADYPNERTIRYYITEGLLDQAIEKRGVTSIFGYEHLLTLLVIKKLQALGLPISVIKDLMLGKSEEELEKLFGEEIHVFTDEEELDLFRASIGHTDDSEVVVMAGTTAQPASPPAADNEAKEYLQSLLMGRSDKPERPPARSRPAAEPKLSRGTSDWRRYEIIPGVELHVARSFRAPREPNWRQRLLVLIDGILDSRERR
ncbi:MAG: MerR family transcriptional regulator [Acidobacteria bacterium]|nr:MerR family transcriptional regulator [Acidobacteriota bacterium]